MTILVFIIITILVLPYLHVRYWARYSAEAESENHRLLAAWMITVHDGIAMIVYLRQWRMILVRGDPTSPRTPHCSTTPIFHNGIFSGRFKQTWNNFFSRSRGGGGLQKW